MYYSMDESPKHDTKWNKPGMKGDIFLFTWNGQNRYTHKDRIQIGACQGLEGGGGRGQMGETA